MFEKVSFFNIDFESILASFFSIWGPNLGPNLSQLPQVKLKKSIFFTILGQPGPT